MDDSKMPRIRRKEDLPDVMTMPLVAKTLGCSLTVAYPDIYDEFVDQTESRIFKVVKSAIA